MRLVRSAVKDRRKCRRGCSNRFRCSPVGGTAFPRLHWRSTLDGWLMASPYTLPGNNTCTTLPLRPTLPFTSPLLRPQQTSDRSARRTRPGSDIPGSLSAPEIMIKRGFRALLERTNPEERRATGPSWIHFRAQDVRNPLVERPFNWFKSPLGHSARPASALVKATSPPVIPAPGAHVIPA